MEIDQKLLADVLQLGGQYAIPAAVLLRALYSGWRGKLPEGLGEIAAASAFAGVTAVADNQQPDLQGIILEMLSNTVFMAGLLSFILLYLLRQPNRGLLFDALVGIVIGVGAWAIWYYVLNHDLSLGTLAQSLGAPPDSLLVPVGDFLTWFAAGACGAVVFVLLRFSLRQIIRVVRFATTLLTIGIILAVIGGGLYLASQAGLLNIAL